MPNWYVYLSAVIALAGASWAYWYTIQGLDKEDPITWIWAGVGFAGIGSFLLLVWPLLVVVMTPYGVYRWANRDRR